VINKDKNPSFQEVKNIVISLLKKSKDGIFISQIKDEILKLYPKFNEKTYNINYTFSKFIKALEPDIKTRSTKVGVLVAYV
jgi:ribosomal protein S24E